MGLLYRTRWLICFSNKNVPFIFIFFWCFVLSSHHSLLPQLRHLPSVPPSVKAVNQLVGAPVESHVLLQCIVEAFPKPLNTWYRNEGIYIYKYIVFDISVMEFFNLLKWFEFFLSLSLSYSFFLPHSLFMFHQFLHFSARFNSICVNNFSSLLFQFICHHVNATQQTNFAADTKLYHGEKYVVTESMINSFTWQMNLTIKNLHKNDFSPFVCASENALGKSDARIRLQGNVISVFEN